MPVTSSMIPSTTPVVLVGAVPAVVVGIVVVGMVAGVVPTVVVGMAVVVGAVVSFPVIRLQPVNRQSVRTRISTMIVVRFMFIPPVIIGFATSISAFFVVRQEKNVADPIIIWKKIFLTIAIFEMFDYNIQDKHYIKENPLL